MHPIPPPLHKQFRRQLGPAIVPVIPAAGNPKETTAATVVTPAPVAEPTTKAGKFHSGMKRAVTQGEE